MHGRAAALTLVLVAACGDSDTPATLYNRALAALRAGELRDAEESARRAAEGGDAAMVARCEFLRGNVAFARCGVAEKQAATAAAEPFAIDVAIRYAERARDLWQVAAMSRADWPAARRNVARALLKLGALRRKRDASRTPRKSDPQPRPAPLPQPRTTPPADDRPDDELLVRELTKDQVRRLLETLARKEKEKRALREAERTARMAGVERDW